MVNLLCTFLIPCSFSLSLFMLALKFFSESLKSSCCPKRCLAVKHSNSTFPSWFSPSPAPIFLLCKSHGSSAYRQAGSLCLRLYIRPVLLCLLFSLQPYTLVVHELVRSPLLCWLLLPQPFTLVVDQLYTRFLTGP